MSPPQDRSLPPLRDPIGLLPDYIAVRSTTLILEETASGYDFDITDQKTGEKVFTVKGHTDSQTVSKEVFDTKGHQIFALRKTNTRPPKNHRLEAPDGSPFMAVEWSWGSKYSLSLAPRSSCTGLSPWIPIPCLPPPISHKSPPPPALIDHKLTTPSPPQQQPTSKPTSPTPSPPALPPPAPRQTSSK